MNHHCLLVERIGPRAPADALTCGVRIDKAAQQSRSRVRRLLPGTLPRSVMARPARGDVCFYLDSHGRQHFNFPQRVWLYSLVPMAVTPGMSIELETLAINLLTWLTQERDYRAAMGITCKRVRRLASRFCAPRLLAAQPPAWVMHRSSPRPLAHSPLLATRVASNEPSLGLLVTQISRFKGEAMTPPGGPGSINFQGVVDNEGGHGQALRRPRRPPPVAAVAKTRGSLPSGAADIGHIGSPPDRAREHRDPRSLSSHPAPSRK